MLNNRFNYVKSESEDFRREYEREQKSPNKERGNKMFKKMMLLLLFILPMAILGPERCKLHGYLAEQNYEVYQWECSGCGYRNYDAINYCPLCGCKRPEGW
jgi:rubrerythrin